MQESPKEKEDGTLAEDQKERDYYYDDSHGYEDYDPEEDEGDAETRGQGDAEKEGRRGEGDLNALPLKSVVLEERGQSRPSCLHSEITHIFPPPELSLLPLRPRDLLAAHLSPANSIIRLPPGVHFPPLR